VTLFVALALLLRGMRASQLGLEAEAAGDGEVEEHRLDLGVTQVDVDPTEEVA
jgi:hypothetical protein